MPNITLDYPLVVPAPTVSEWYSIYRIKVKNADGTIPTLDQLTTGGYKCSADLVLRWMGIPAPGAEVRYPMSDGYAAGKNTTTNYSFPFVTVDGVPGKDLRIGPFTRDPYLGGEFYLRAYLKQNGAQKDKVEAVVSVQDGAYNVISGPSRVPKMRMVKAYCKVCGSPVRFTSAGKAVCTMCPATYRVIAR